MMETETLPYTDGMHAAAVNAYNSALAWYGPMCTMEALRAAVVAALDAAVNENVISISAAGVE